MTFVAPLLAVLSLGLSETPMIGVACPRQPNITTCGRIGIAVWLKRPATAATADLAGATVRLHAGGFGGEGPAYWEGYVRLSRQRLGLPVQWYGTKPVRFLRLHLVIRYPARTARGTLRLQLRPGWG
jgi:hypothetical protein